MTQHNITGPNGEIYLVVAREDGMVRLILPVPNPVELRFNDQALPGLIDALVAIQNKQAST